MIIDTLSGSWRETNVDIFWAEHAQSQHVLQIYKNDTILLETLASFVSGGLHADESIIVIATKEHLYSLAEKLTALGFDLPGLESKKRYNPFDASEVLSRFMVDSWPNEELFFQTISGVLKTAGYHKNRIRVFGEMVAVLWAQGLNAATISLEHLWNKFCIENPLCLFCAYPENLFSDELNSSIQHICGSHTKIIDGTEKSLGDLVYCNASHSKVS